VPPGTPLPGDADLVILPGTKATLADLAFLRAQGWDIDILAHVRRGGRVLGVCGGYQMLGRTVAIRRGSRARRLGRGAGPAGRRNRAAGRQDPAPVSGRLPAATRPSTGYEMHIGRTTGLAARPMLTFDDGAADGAVSADGRVAAPMSTACSSAARRGRPLLARDHAARVDVALDEIAAMLERSLDIEAIARIAGV
jgi:adenosylcobyric acid synthase